VSNRKVAAWFAALVFLWFGIIAAALYLTTKYRTRPSVFVPPAIWSIPHTGGEPRKEFEI
jgi:hypothetical protein